MNNWNAAGAAIDILADRTEGITLVSPTDNVNRWRVGFWLAGDHYVAGGDTPQAAAEAALKLYHTNQIAKAG